jgi:early secretory antigenic target protein ESAT-6
MTIQITYGTVTAAAEDIRGAATQISGELQNLDTRVQKVVNNWDGEAKAAYQRKHTTWSTDVEGLASTLRQIARALDDSTAGYQSTDKRAATQFDF